MLKLKKYRKKWAKGFSIKRNRYLPFLALVIIGALLLLARLNKNSQNQNLNAYANSVLSTCSNNSYRPSCYDKEIPALMDQISMEDAFKVTRLVQEKDSTYQYCHVLGHDLSAREVRKDPSKWKEVVSRCPSGVCSNGCIHGGFQERFRSESLTDQQILQIKPDLETICEDRTSWHPTGLEQASCYHALGHLTMYLTSADLKKSLILCDGIAIKTGGRDYSQLCYDGVFMQIFQPLEPEDFALVKGKQPNKDAVLAYCANFNGAQKGSCLSEAWPLFREEIAQPTGLIRYCSQESRDQEDRCFNALEYVLVAQFNFDQEKITSFCGGLISTRQGQCFSNAASRLIETDYRNISKSVSICQTASQFGVSESCFRELAFYASFNFRPGSQESQNLCQSLPDTWRNQCGSGSKN